MLRIPKIMHTCKKAFLLGTLFSTSLAITAEAADLQEKLVVTDAVVRLSDIFTDTGANGEQVIMEAPAPGKRKSISNYELVRIAEKHQVEWDRPAYLKRVYIHREGIPFDLNDMSETILQAARQQDLTGDVEIKVFGRKVGLYLPYGNSIDDIELTDFQLTGQRNRFSAVILIPTGTTETFEQRISGTIEEVRLIPMFNRVIASGEVITKADLEWKKFPVRRLTRNAVVASSQLIGQTVKRAISANKLILQNDIMTPVVVSKGSIVLMTYKRGRLSLTMQGRALENGGTGDTIRLMNQKSKKTVFGVVVGDDAVEIASKPMLKLASR